MVQNLVNIEFLFEFYNFLGPKSAKNYGLNNNLVRKMYIIVRNLLLFEGCSYRHID